MKFFNKEYLNLKKMYSGRDRSRISYNESRIRMNEYSRTLKIVAKLFAGVLL